MDLHWAIREGDRGVLKELLGGADVDVNAKDEDGGTALHLAAVVGHVDIVRALLEAANVDVNAKDENGRTALYLAVVVGHVDIVRALLEAANVDVNAEDENGRTALHWVAIHWTEQEENVAIVRTLLDAAKEDINRVDNYGMTVLHSAARVGHIDLVKELLGRVNVEVNIMDNDDWTALHWAVWVESGRIVEALLGDARVDANLSTKTGCSALHLAVLAANAYITRILANNPNVIFAQEDKYEKIPIEVAHYMANASDGARISVLFRRMGFNVRTMGYNVMAQRIARGASQYVKVEESLMNSTVGKVFMDNLYRDRQVYVDAANSILVGAALIASVTFASWLQPPLNYIDSSYVPSSYTPSSQPKYADVEHNAGLGVFWVFNSLSFYFAIGTVVLGASSVLPRRRLFIKEDVERLRRNLLWTSFLLALSVLCVLIAFGTAGIIVLVPILKPRLYMIVPMIIGGMVCVICLGYLLYSILEETWLKDHGHYFKKIPNF